MNIYAYTILFAFVMSICCGNSSLKASGEYSNKQSAVLSSNFEKPDSLAKISLTVIDGIFIRNAGKITVKFTNNTDSSVNTGTWYKIEILSDSGEWVGIDLKKVLFPLVDYTILPGESTEFEIYMYPAMINYAPGQYRIWKEVTIEGDKELFNAPFTIK